MFALQAKRSRHFMQFWIMDTFLLSQLCVASIVSASLTGGLKKYINTEINVEISVEFLVVRGS
jgi:hypothetical protein